jgi:hypothetical protein
MVATASCGTVMGRSATIQTGVGDHRFLPYHSASRARLSLSQTENG